MKQQNWMITTACSLALVTQSMSGMALGASQDKESSKVKKQVIVQVDGADLAPHVMVRGFAGPGGGPGQGDVMTFVSSEMSFDNKVVKGAPYTADAVTEHIQSLSDGNRIVRKSTSSVSRDGEGRTRREQVMGAIGPWAVAGNPPQTVFINDPVSGVNYVLDPQARTARKLTLFRPDEPFEGKRVERGHRMMMETVEGTGRGGRDMMVAAHAFNVKLADPKTESLGKQVIEGLEAEGTRTTITIPAGEIGNERAIEIISEQWYSPALQTVVQSRHTDPRAGESTFKLTNLNRTEPARSLFEVPADYTVKDAGSGPERIMKWKTQKPGEE